MYQPLGVAMDMVYVSDENVYLSSPLWGTL